MISEIALENVREGMLLAKPIRNKVGQVMINKDVELTAKHINILKMWGIQIIAIKDGTEEEVDVKNQSTIDIIKQQILSGLGWNIDHPILDEIIELAAYSHFRTIQDNE